MIVTKGLVSLLKNVEEQSSVKSFSLESFARKWLRKGAQTFGVSFLLGIILVAFNLVIGTLVLVLSTFALIVIGFTAAFLPEPHNTSSIRSKR